MCQDGISHTGTLLRVTTSAAPMGIVSRATILPDDLTSLEWLPTSPIPPLDNARNHNLAFIRATTRDEDLHGVTPATDRR